MVEGHVPWFGRSVIRSCTKLDYGTAQRMIEGKEEEEEEEEERRR